MPNVLHFSMDELSSVPLAKTMRPPTEAAPIPRVAIWILRCLDHPLVLLARLALRAQVVRQHRENQAVQRGPADLCHLSDQADRPALQSSQRVLSK
jgi:hypothetical protein